MHILSKAKKGKSLKEIEDILKSENIKYNEPMSKHTSFKVGGPAEIFTYIDSISDLQKVLDLCKEKKLPITIVGNGSNLLVSDEGIKGVVIKYTANEIKIDKETGKVVCSGGVINSVLAMQLKESELSGFEFAASIPGTIAGAIYMNAGAFGCEMKDIVNYVKYIDISTGEMITLHNNELEFGYRKSIFEQVNGVIVEIEMQLHHDDKANIENKMIQYKEKRLESQPLEYPSAGSTFKRGEDFISAKLIDEAGLKGYKIGGAQVSTKHAGFIVNTGNATAKDILELIEYVKKVVYDKFNKKLEIEVKII